MRDAALIRSTIDVAAGHDLGAVITDLARRNAQAATSTVTERAAVRLEAEARLLSGDVDGAERRLSTLERTNRDSLAARLHETLVRARLDHARGRHVEAERRITTGNRLLAAHQFQSSSLDVRAALALHGRRLAAFDVERALESQDADGILTSIERWRAISHRINPVTTSSDPELTAMTRELRRLRRVAAERGPCRCRARRRRSPSSRTTWRSASGPSRSVARRPVPLPPVDADEAAPPRRTGDATVVEFFETGDELWTIVLDDGNLEVAHTGTRRRWCASSSPGCGATCGPGPWWRRGPRWRRPCTGRARHPSPPVDTTLNPAGPALAPLGRPAGGRHPVAHPGRRAVEPAAQPAGSAGHRAHRP